MEVTTKKLACCEQMTWIWKHGREYAMDAANHDTPIFGSTLLHLKNSAVAWIAVWSTLLVCGGVFHAIEAAKDRRTTLAHDEDYQTLIASVDDDTVVEDVDFVLEWMVEHGDCTIPTVDDPNWDFSSSMYLAFQLISTIGYGVFAPATPSGRWFAVFVVVAFLPLFNHAIKLLGIYIGVFFRFVQTTIFKDTAWHTKRVYGTVAIFLLFFWMCIGATLFLHRKPADRHHFDFRDGLYFTFVTVSTVGLGDYSFHTAFTEPAGIIWSIIGIAMFNEVMDCVSSVLNNIGTKVHTTAVNVVCGSEEVDNKLEEQASEASSEKSGTPVEVAVLDLNDKNAGGTPLDPLDELKAAVASLATTLFFFVPSIAIGGAIISAFEHPREEKFSGHWHDVKEAHEENLNEEQIGYLESIIANMVSGSICSTPVKGEWDWSFSGSYFFVFTVFSTIGYGFYAPKTQGGRAFTVVLGIPGFVICGNLISAIAELPGLLGRAQKQLAACIEHKNKNFYPVLCSVALVLLGGAWYMTPAAENGWNMWIAMWFWFQTLSTVGFGDFEPENWGSTAANVFTIFWALVGIAAFNVFFEQMEGVWAAHLMFHSETEEVENELEMTEPNNEVPQEAAETNGQRTADEEEEEEERDANYTCAPRTSMASAYC